jgi:hypothetical protein
MTTIKSTLLMARVIVTANCSWAGARTRVADGAGTLMLSGLG